MPRSGRRPVERSRAAVPACVLPLRCIFLVLALTLLAQPTQAEHSPDHARGQSSEAPDVEASTGLSPIETLRQMGLRLIGDEAGELLRLERAFDLSTSVTSDGAAPGPCEGGGFTLDLECLGSISGWRVSFAAMENGGALL